MLKVGEALPGFEARRLPGHAPAFWRGGPEIVASRDLISASPVLIVVKADCPTCLYAMPFFERLFRLHAGFSPVILLAQESEAGARRMVAANRLKMPVLLDENPYSIGEALGVSFVPAAVLVSSSGEIEISFESFEREALREVHERLSRLHDRSEIALYREDETVDAFRPG